MTVLSKNLVNAVAEKDVESVYKQELVAELRRVFKEKDYSINISSPYNSDGLIEVTENKTGHPVKIKTLLEFKYQEVFKNKLSQCGVLIQCLYYLKKFEDSGNKLPSTIFVGDKNECFAIHTNAIVKYLSSEIDWKVAPSDAHKKNPELLKAMVGDTDILPFVYDVDKDFSIKTVINKISDLSSNVVKKMRITKNNIVAIFEYFDKNVLGKVGMTTNDKANLFIQIIINPDKNYLHPKLKNTLIAESFGNVVVDQNLFRSFFKHFEGDLYAPKEKEELTSLVDRLIEDSVRRNKGEFFTPTPFVNLAHSYISQTFGEDWRDEYTVWDCAWGTGNLTRDHRFKELYCSTLEQSDIDTANQMGYNPAATKFQMDFLNDPIFDCAVTGEKSRVPASLQEALRWGKVLFLINPPFGTANNMGTKAGDHKGGIARTTTNAEMKKAGWGACSQQLYAQFLYRIYKLRQENPNIKVGLFSTPSFLTGSSFKKFRSKFLDVFGFEKGFLFQASHFADVSGAWGVSFTVFGSESKAGDFNVDLAGIGAGFEIAVSGSKLLYNTDTVKAASAWVREEVKGMKTYDAPQISSAIKVKPKGRGKLVRGSLGYMLNLTNVVAKNATAVCLISGAFSGGNGLSLVPANFTKGAALFTARKTIKGSWINHKDEYLAPNETHPAYEQFIYDSIVYSLFNNSSEQSSLRQVEYKGSLHDIKNEFFWLSSTQMKELANSRSFDALYNDARTAPERYAYKILFEQGIYDKLSSDARAILDTATGFLVESMSMRKLVAGVQPEYHLHAWDAGYAQLKLIWKQHYPDEFKAFRDNYKRFEDRLRPLVYDLGFLKS